MTLNLPAIRNIVVWRLEAFADPEYQEKVWHQGVMPRENYSDDFHEAVNDLLDAFDTGEVIDPQRAVGVSLYTEDEADLIVDVIQALNGVLAGIGQLGTFEQARSHLGWPKVVETAASALAGLRPSGTA